MVPQTIFMFVENFFSVISALLLSTIAVYWLALALLPFFYVMRWLQHIFRTNTRQLLRWAGGD